MPKPTFALIVAAGSGSRVGGECPKQYLPLHGLPLLRHSVLAFLNHPHVDGVQVVYHPDHRDYYDLSVGDLGLPEPVKGGKTRQESVRLGLEALKSLKPHKVLIHDAARPLVSEEVISRVIGAIAPHVAAIPALPVEDTLKKCADGKILQTINRKDLMRAQTPQGFIYKEILDAHRQVEEMEFTDDASIREYLGNEVVIVPGSQLNFKITEKEDFERAEKIMTTRDHFTTRIGTGFDVHAFCEAKQANNNHVMLCGVAVPYDRSLAGHSDADVGIHALVDALLGAIGEGDIGEHFPPSNMAFKNADSKIFLEHARDLVSKKNGKINNVDVTLICEAPRLSDYKEAMAKRLADILHIHTTQVNVKATTTEKLGFTGRGEGIAAQAAVSVVVAG